MYDANDISTVQLNFFAIQLNDIMYEVEIEVVGNVEAPMFPTSKPHITDYE